MAMREEEPISEFCDFGVVYSLYLRPAKNNSAPRVILKVTWEEKDAKPNEELRSCTFDVDLDRERLIALGRKGNSLPPERFPAKWFCNWARKSIAENK